MKQLLLLIACALITNLEASPLDSVHHYIPVQFLDEECYKTLKRSGRTYSFADGGVKIGFFPKEYWKYLEDEKFVGEVGQYTNEEGYRIVNTLQAATLLGYQMATDTQKIEDFQKGASIMDMSEEIELMLFDLSILSNNESIMVSIVCKFSVDEILQINFSDRHFYYIAHYLKGEFRKKAFNCLLRQINKTQFKDLWEENELQEIISKKVYKLILQEAEKVIGRK